MKIAIAGAGKLGLKIAEALLVGDHSVTIIDKDEEVLQKLTSHMDILTVNANAKQISILEEMKIGTFDYFLAATDRDEKNIVIASFAKKLGCSKVIARVRDPEHMNQMGFIKETMGIDFIVNPDLAITVEIYKYLVEKYSLSNGIFSSGKVSLLEFPANKMPQIIGVSMFNIGQIFPNMLVVSISRNGKIIIPHGETTIHAGDGLYIMGQRLPIQKLSSKVHEKGKYTGLQKVMIIGGGKTGLYLAKKLAEFGIAVKIIEKDKARCHYLAAHLDDVMILHGDATDISLLEEENLNDMDAVVTATGFDEDNLLLALMAKQHNIEDVIAKVSRASYADLIEKMGIDMALNPLDITAASIIRFIQGSKRVISSQLIQGQAEIMEIIAEKHMPLINTPLKNLHLPDGVIIAALHRGLDVIIPSGETKILEGDRVITVSLLSALSDLEKMLTSNRPSFLSRR
ncbi:Trk system potassium transporter TrkA [Clostridium aminobutyricum]|uniref:Trk system potassium uptake protein TrkA n=1 Tax=Clostridium aminobutyricum TaxID=33953 RepID=A0A939D726_CLOAM|nr:Trk system potassium transporter TrkA [Clostridium aminobutyricum]MBN7772028.1 Trk system potassium transporter TrkA [Clostridium aminobutyricum]